jgi:hypothetical protein
MTAERSPRPQGEKIVKKIFKTKVFAQTAARAAKLTLGAGLLATVAITLTPQTTLAQGLSIDNFATGAVKMEGTTTVTSAPQTGTGILGGNRLIQITPNWFGTNVFLQPVQVQVRPGSSTADVPSALLLSNGYNAFPRVDLFYGPTGITPTSAPLNLNMTLYQGFGLSFAGLSNGLEVILTVWDVNGVYADVACVLTSSPNVKAFALNAPTANFTGSVDWSNIKTVALSFLAGNIYGTPNVAITEFSTTSIPAAGALSCGSPAT